MNSINYVRECMAEDEYYGLFPKSDMYLVNHSRKGKPSCWKGLSETTKRMLKYNHLDMLIGTKFSAPIELPIRFPEVRPYNGPVSFEMNPFTKRKNFLKKGYGIHFFEYDYLFSNQLSADTDQITMELLKVSLVIAPDFSMFADTDDTMFNIGSKWKSMLFTNHFQRAGIPVVPVASWGNADTLKWAFSGLPHNSIIAVCGVGHKRREGEQLLWRYAMSELEKQLSPTLLIIYGSEDDISWLHTPTKFISDYITKRFRK